MGSPADRERQRTGATTRHLRRVGMLIAGLLVVCPVSQAENVDWASYNVSPRGVLERMRSWNNAFLGGRVAIGADSVLSTDTRVPIEIRETAVGDGPIMVIDGDPNPSVTLPREFFGAVTFARRGDSVGVVAAYRDGPSTMEDSASLVLHTQEDALRQPEQRLKISRLQRVGIVAALNTAMREPRASLEIEGEALTGWDDHVVVRNTTSSTGASLVMTTRKGDAANDHTWQIIATDARRSAIPELQADSLVFWDPRRHYTRQGFPPVYGGAGLTISRRGFIGLWNTPSPQATLDFGSTGLLNLSGESRNRWWAQSSWLVPPSPIQVPPSAPGCYNLGFRNSYAYCALSYWQRRSSGSTSCFTNCYVQRIDPFGGGGRPTQWQLCFVSGGSHCPMACQAICAER